MLANKDAIIDSIKREDFVAFNKAVKQEIDIKVKQNPFVKKQLEIADKYKSIEKMYKEL